MVLETHMKLCEIYLDFPENCILIAKLGKWTKNRPKTRFFEFIKKFGNWFRLNLFYNENLYYLLCSYTNPIFGKKFFLRYGPKCYQPIRLREFLVNHISWAIYWNSLIFCMLIQVHINEKLIEIFWVDMEHNQKFLGVLWHFTLFTLVTSNVVDIEVTQNIVIANRRGRITL